jgi:hypothetical protein
MPYYILNIFQRIAFPRPYRFELLEGSAKQVSDRRGRRKQGKQAPSPVFYKGDNFGPHQKTQLISKLEVFQIIYIYNQISVIDILITTFLVIIHPDSRIA